MILTFAFILAGIIFMVASLIYVKKKQKLQATGLMDNSNEKHAKRTLNNIWGIDDVNNQIITVSRKQHSIIVELESIEYNLLREDEKNIVDRELVGIAQMLKFPIQFLQIKKQISMSEAIENIKLNTKNSNTYIKEYAKEITKHLEKIEENQDLFERKNYIIITSYNLNKKIAEMELREFYQSLYYHLINIKVNARLLEDTEILELIYEQLHKGSKNKVTEMIEKGGLDLYVTSKKNKAI